MRERKPEEDRRAGDPIGGQGYGIAMTIEATSGAFAAWMVPTRKRTAARRRKRGGAERLAASPGRKSLRTCAHGCNSRVYARLPKLATCGGGVSLASTLAQERGVAITIEAVSAAYRVRIGGADALEAGKGRDQHQQRRARQMKIGEQRVNGAEAIARRDEDVGLARERF